MFFHYVKFAKTALLKNRYYTILNAIGLVCGMLATLIIAKYIGGSLQFDKFHDHIDSIYGIKQEEYVNNSPQQKRESTYWGVGEIIKQYPEVIHMTRYGYHVGSLVMTDEEQGHKVMNMEDNIAVADSSFLKVFTFPFIYGNAATALSGNNAVVLTSTTSQQYFGHINPVGRVLTMRVPWGEETTYEVTGVMEDIPKNSRFQFGFLVNSAPIDEAFFWSMPDFATYILLKPHADVHAFVEKLNHTVNEVAPLKSTNRRENMVAESLADVKLSNAEYLLIAVGIFIFIISWGNYINQVIAQSYWRTKDIGVFRVMGATRVNLQTQFVVESSLVCLSSFCLVIAIYALLEQPLQAFTNGHMLPLWGDPTIINSFFLTIFIMGLILAAVVPAVIVLPQNFGTTLQNASWSKIGSVGLRKGLIIVQFTISTILIIGIFVINDQLEYMRTQSKGMSMNNVLVVKAPILPNSGWSARRKSLALFKEKCAQLPFVMNVTSSTTVPSEEYRRETYISMEGQADKFLVHQNGIDEFYFGLYDVKFIAGQNFIPNANQRNQKSIILNESAARSLGIHDDEKIINTKIIDHETNTAYDLIGIVKDFHQTSLKYTIKPMAFKYEVIRGHVSLRMNTAGVNNSQSAARVNSIQHIWEEIYHDATFDSFLLDEKFMDQDREDMYFGKLFKYFTLLSMLISCSGLFGLSLLLSTKRQKEIGIRKVFGASSLNILAVFLRGYLGPLSISLIAGAPIAYLLMDRWLRNYAYRIDIGLGIVTGAILTLVMIFLVTIAYHTIRSAITNPTTILRE